MSLPDELDRVCLFNSHTKLSMSVPLSMENLVGRVIVGRGID